MCGIIAVLRRPSDRKVPTAERITAPLVGAVDLLARVELDLLGAAADLLDEADRLLGGEQDGEAGVTGNRPILS